MALKIWKVIGVRRMFELGEGLFNCKPNTMRRIVADVAHTGLFIEF